MVLLILVAGVGIFLLLSGASERRWELLASGSACAAASGWPIRYLIDLRRFNLLLQTLPDIIRMANTQVRQDLLISFVEKLMGRL